MARYPDAVWKPLLTRKRREMTSPKRINLHTAVSNSKSLYGYFSTNTRGVYSHFYIRKDGVVEQYMDTKYRAVCDYQGNPDTISIESWDGATANIPEWNAAQLAALAKLVRWIMNTHPTIPRKLASSNRKSGTESHGLSSHRLGVPGYMKYSVANGGLLYTLSNRKTCPGDKRFAQVPTVLKLAFPPAQTGTTPTPPVKVSLSGVRNAARKDPGLPSNKTTNWANAIIVERALVKEGLLASKWSDGHFGTMTLAAYSLWQNRCGYKGADADGIPGRSSLVKLGKKHGFSVVD